MIGAVIVIGERGWVLPAVGLTVALLLLVWWAYRRVTWAGGVRTAAIALKVLGIALLAACLVEPLWSSVRARPGANLFAIIADNSRSLRIRDETTDKPIGQSLESALADRKEGWQVRLQQDFDVRRYLLDSRLRHTEDFSQLAFDGRATNLATALKTLSERYRELPLAGVLLFTDGNATDLPAGPLDLENLPPVYPVLLGDGDVPRDVGIEMVSVSRTGFEDAPVTIRADISGRGDIGSAVTARLLDEQGQLVEEITEAIDGPNRTASMRFQLRPRQSGVSFYRLQVSPKKDPSQAADHQAAAEATLENNTRVITVDRGHGPYRILYVSGRPNWEFKFLRRALDADEQIDLVALIRIAEREPKFEWRGRAGESSNPLFRGFKGNVDAETERYDQPVLVRLNTKDAAELRDGFPTSEKELFRYHAVILDDVESNFFTHDQQTLLRQFVSARGGGLLMLGGQEMFHQGGYRRTPVGDALPVYLGRAPAGRPGTGFRLVLTREGWLQPWVRLRRKESEEKQRLDDMPIFRTLNRVESAKPGADVLATVAGDDGKQHPALVAQRFGRGRSAVVTIGDFWRWQLKRDDVERDDLGKAWRQMLRWLVADVPNRIDVQTAFVKGNRSTVSLQVRVRTPEFVPLENGDVSVSITPPDGKPVKLIAEPSLREPGLYEAVYVPREAGAYRALVTVADADDRAVGTASTGFSSDPAVEEFRSVIPNRPLVEQIAKETGGRVVDLAALDDFVTGLATAPVPITEQWTTPLWHQPWVFLLAVVCLAGEWGLRRWKGLP